MASHEWEPGAREFRVNRTRFSRIEKSNEILKTGFSIGDRDEVNIEASWTRPADRKRIPEDQLRDLHSLKRNL
ncbi:hypothetical protein YC2023_079613 [Brassica napus]